MSEIRKNRKKHELPSGLVVEIRRPGPLAIRILAASKGLKQAEASGMMGPQPVIEDDSRASAIEDGFSSLARFVCECTVQPKLSVEDPPPAGAEYLDDALCIADFNALLEELVAFAAIPQAEARLRPLSETPTSS